MAARTMYLQLPPELGGLRFGPFAGSCTIGSDPKRVQLHLDASHGIFPVHLTVTHTAQGLFTLVPASRECKVFLTPLGQAHTWPVTGPVQAKAGDLLIVGTVSGPRFQLQTEQPATSAPSASQIVATARQTGGEAGLLQAFSQMMDGMLRPSGSGISGEINRQLTARALSRPGPIRTMYVVWTKIRSGTLFSPYVIVALGIAIIGLIGTGSLSCSGLLYVVMDVLNLRR